MVFVTDRKTPVEEQGPKQGQTWVTSGTTQREMLQHFDGWGPQVLKLLSVNVFNMGLFKGTYIFQEYFETKQVVFTCI